MKGICALYLYPQMNDIMVHGHLSGYAYVNMFEYLIWSDIFLPGHLANTNTLNLSLPHFHPCCITRINHKINIYWAHFSERHLKIETW